MRIPNIKYFFFIAAFSLPTSIVVIRYAFILFGVALLFYAFKKNDLDKPTSNKILFLPVLFFLIYMVTMILHPPLDFYQLEKRLPFIVIPLLIFFSNIRLDIDTRLYSMRGFVLGNYFVSIFNIARAIYRSTKIENGQINFDSTVWGNIPVWESIDHVGNYFFSEQFTYFIHPSYWALFLIVAIIFIWLHNPLQSKTWWRVATILIFLAMIFLCNSRAGMVAVSFVILILIFTNFEKFTSLKSKLVILVFTLFVFGLIAVTPKMKGSIQSIQEKTLNQSLRINCWYSAVSIIERNFFFGVGLQHAESEMIKEYEQRGLEEHVKLKLNAHNQYLDTAMSTGLLGLLGLLIILLIAVKRALRHKDLAFVLFIISISFYFCFESMLNRFHGIVSFTFFFIIFLCHDSRQKFISKNVG